MTYYTADNNVISYSNDSDNNGVYESSSIFGKTKDGGIYTQAREYYYNDTGTLKELNLFNEDNSPFSKTMYDKNGKVIEESYLDKFGNTVLKRYEHYNDGSLKSTTTIDKNGKEEVTYQDSYFVRLFKH